MTPKQRRLERIRAIQREFLVASLAAEDLEGRLRANPSVLDASRLELVNYRDFRRHLEATYIIRLFAEIEAGLREAWELAFHRTTIPSARDLIESLHAQCMISNEWCAGTNDVRIYRNALVHEGGGDAEPVELRQACADLCRFLSGLPHHW